jgi:hypothetical protein
MSAQLGKYLIVIVRGRVENGSIPPGNAPYIFAIPANAEEDRPLGWACQWLTPSRNVVVYLSLAKMLSRGNGFKISEIQEDETEAVLTRRSGCNNVTLV